MKRKEDDVRESMKRMQERTMKEWDEQMVLMKKRRCVMGNGNIMSVQASAYHYCSPRKDNADNYTTVEVAFFDTKVLEDGQPTMIGGEPLSNVSATQLNQFIIDNGGIVSGELPPMEGVQ